MALQAPDSAFDRLSSVQATSPGHFVANLPDTWQQGRGLFGGLVVSVLIRALEEAAPGRPLRSLTSEICGSVQPGEATLIVETLREGSGVTTAAARLVQNGEVQAHAVGVLGKARVADRDLTVVPAPKLRPWRDVDVLPIGPPMGPVFVQHFEMRPTGPLPFSGGELAEVSGWTRPKHPGEKRDAAYLAACVDAYWPAIFSLEKGPRPMATIAFTFQPFVRFEGLDADAPVFYRAKLLASDAGYAVEQRELWGEDGRLLALNQQTFVLIK